MPRTDSADTMSKRGGRQAAAESPVVSLVAAITKHKNFKSLCGYSVKSLATVVGPPLIGWEANASEALACGAVKALAYVVGKHSSSGVIVEHGTRVRALVRWQPGALPCPPARRKRATCPKRAASAAQTRRANGPRAGGAARARC